MEIHIFFAQIAWLAFIVTMIIRPLANLYPKKPIIFFLRYRRLLGLISGYGAIMHAFVYIYYSDLLFTYFTDTTYWDYRYLFFWGNLGLILMLFPFITSNNISQKILRTKWKKIQMLAYPAFVLTGVHISFAKENWFAGFLPIIIWLILLFLADRKIKS
jgi:DMSO/TMAO reductase YedYZ heme-binding membrane subunit